MKRLLLLFLLLPLTTQAQIVEPPANILVVRQGKGYFIELTGWAPHPEIPPRCNDISCRVERTFKIDLGKRVRIEALRAFVAFDKGDHFEAGFIVFADDGTPFYGVSEHKEVSSDYDAWHPLENLQPLNIKTRYLTVVASAQNHHPSEGGRPHFALLLYEN